LTGRFEVCDGDAMAPALYPTLALFDYVAGIDLAAALVLAQILADLGYRI
jgi:hypothetical protein